MKNVEIASTRMSRNKTVIDCGDAGRGGGARLFWGFTPVFLHARPDPKRSIPKVP